MFAEKGAKNAEKTKIAKRVVKKLYLRNNNNPMGYQTETVAIALGYFMMRFRTLFGEKKCLPEIDLEAELIEAQLPVQYRWVGSIQVMHFANVESAVSMIKQYEDWLQAYISRRAKKDGKGPTPAVLERKAINRSFYCTIASTYSDATKLSWAKAEYCLAKPGLKDYDFWAKVEAKFGNGVKFTREQDKPIQVQVDALGK
jgi:hypothetical protein